MKRTYQPSKLVRKRRHGFRARLKTTGAARFCGRPSCARTQAAQRLIPARAIPAPAMHAAQATRRFPGRRRRAPGPPAGGFVLQARDRHEDGPVRVGFTCSKKVGNSVERNRVRRRLREVVRPCAALRDAARL